MREPVAKEPFLGEGLVGPEVAQHLRMLVSEVFDLVVNRSLVRAGGASAPGSGDPSPGDPPAPGLHGTPSGSIAAGRASEPGTSEPGTSEPGGTKPGTVRIMARWSPSEHLLAAEQLMVAGANRLSRVLDCQAGSPPFLGPVRLASPPQVQHGMALEVIARQMTQAAERFARIVESMRPHDGSRRFVSEGSPSTLGELVADIVARFELHLHAVVSSLGTSRLASGSDASSSLAESPVGSFGPFVPLNARSAPAPS